mmetsp:Transcript_34045/g.80771  ORF Transcript_34045/g.80771 Transcript_34045/m.80771 type:complete len:225 (+) Transcript_34045:514-1188(+)
MSQSGRMTTGWLTDTAYFLLSSSNSWVPYIARPAAMIRMKSVIDEKKCLMSPICLPIQKTIHPKTIPARMPTSPPMTVPRGSSPVPTAPRKMRVSRPSRKTAENVRKKIVPQLTSETAASSLDEESSDCSSTAPNLLPWITTLPVLIACALTPYLALILAMNPTSAGPSSTTSLVKSLEDHLRSMSAKRRKPIPRYVRKMEARSEKMPSKIIMPSFVMIVALTE